MTKAVKADADGDAPATVTVVTALDRPSRQWTATAIEITDEGALLVGDGEKDGVAEVFAIYAPGHWASAALDDHQATPGASTADLEALIGEIETAASDENTTVERLEVIRERLRRYRETGR